MQSRTIASCQGLKESGVAKVQQNFTAKGLFERTYPPRQAWGKGLGAALYTPAEEAKSWMFPNEAESCPSKGKKPSAPEGMRRPQRLVLGCIACKQQALIRDENASPIRQADVRKCVDLEQPGSVRSTFERLVSEGHMEAHFFPGTRKTDYYTLTESGAQWLDSLSWPKSCIRGKLNVVENPATGKPRKSTTASDQADGSLHAAGAEPATLKENAGTVLTPDDRANSTNSQAVRFYELPTRDFQNGSQLLRYLETTPYRSDTMLTQLTTVLRETIRKRMPGPATIHVDDILQEVLTAVTSRKTNIAFPDPGLQIIYGITAHKIADLYRSKHRQATTSLDAKSASTIAELEVSQTDRSYDVDDLPARLNARLAVEGIAQEFNLTPVEMSILEVMAFGSSHTNSRVALDAEEIARRHNTTPGAIRVAKHRLLQKLRNNEDLRIRWLADD